MGFLEQAQGPLNSDDDSGSLFDNCSTQEDWRSLIRDVAECKKIDALPAALDAAVRLDSLPLSFWADCAIALSSVDVNSAAESAFRQAISSHPEEAGLFDAFGLFLLEQGREQEAADLYFTFLNTTASGSPHLESILIHLARVLLRLGRNESALEVLLQLSLLSPEHREVDLLVATAFKNLMDYEQAIVHFQKALPSHESFVDLLLEIGDCFNKLNRPDLAAIQYEDGLSRALSDNDRKLLQISLAQMCFRIGEHDRSIEIYNEILKFDPKNVLAHYFLLVSLSVVGRPYVGQMKLIAQSLWKSYREGSDILASAPYDRSYLMPQDIETGTQQKIKVGILSSEIGDHVVGFFLAPFLENYDRLRFHVEILSVRKYNDQRGEYLMQLADSVTELAGLDQMQARRVIQAKNFDIIVETSGYLHSAGLFILAARCAPVQCHYIGFHATTGLDTIDYFIGDVETASEEFFDDYTERLWRLPRPWLARSYSDGLPIAQSKATYNGPVIGCFSSLHKLNKLTLDHWGLALQAVPESILIVKDRLSSVAPIQQRILTHLGAFGVEPSRVTFMGQTSGWQEHMNHFNLIDIAFDTTPWSGATTAFDTVSMGVPLIAIRGDCTTARMSSSVLKAIGAESWISESPEEFASITKMLADDFMALRTGKESFQHRVLNSTLYDGVGLARCLEQSFEEMLQESINKGGFNPAQS